MAIDYQRKHPKLGVCQSCKNWQSVMRYPNSYAYCAVWRNTRQIRTFAKDACRDWSLLTQDQLIDAIEKPQETQSCC